MECQVVKNSLIIASLMLIKKHLAISLSHMLTKRSNRSIICSHTPILLISEDSVISDIR